METAVLVAVVINILATIFGAGRLYQKVESMSNHMSHLEKRFDKLDDYVDDVSKRLAKVEGKLES